MPTIRLGDEDRERFGCEESLPFEDRVLTTEGEALEDAGGSIKALADRSTVAWWRTTVWLALYRAGIRKPYDEVHFDLNAIQIQDDEPGKAKSGSSASRTRRTSASSTPRSRRTGSKS